MVVAWAMQRQGRTKTYHGSRPTFCTELMESFEKTAESHTADHERVFLQHFKDVLCESGAEIVVSCWKPRQWRNMYGKSMLDERDFETTLALELI